MRNCKILILSVLLAALISIGSTQDNDFEKDMLGNTCRNQKGNDCQLKPTTTSYKGSRQLQKKALSLYEKEVDQKASDESERKSDEYERSLDEEIDLPPEIKQEQLKQKYGDKSLQSDGNIRKLFSVNPQVPTVDEADFIAYEQNFIYLFSQIQGELQIYEVSGTNLILVHSQSIPPNHRSYYLVVSNGMIGWVVRDFSTFPYQIKVYLKYHDIFSGTVTDIQEFQRIGYPVAARELNGQLHLISQHNVHLDQWDHLGGSFWPTFAGCNSWIFGSQQRNLFTISLTTTPYYQSTSFLFCDYARVAMLSELGNWYIGSMYWDSVPNMIIQKAHINNHLLSEWEAIPNIYINSHHWLYEQHECQLKVAGRTFSTPNRLRLVRIGCASNFTTILNGFYGPINSYVYGLRWTRDYLYASFRNYQIIKYDAVNFAVEGTITHNFYVRSIYEYGKDHLIGLCYGNTASGNVHTIVTLYSTLNPSTFVPEFVHRMEYRIIPSNSYVYGYIWDGGNQFANIDYSVRMVALPIYSNQPDPWTRGLFYLRVEVDTADPAYCMIHPSTSCSDPVALSFSKSFTPPGHIYKHWNSPPALWPASGSFNEYVTRILVVRRNFERYLVTHSRCQLQIRDLEHPGTWPWSFPYSPPGTVDLCP